ncbi:sugar efflux transporter B [Listeria monocytogenes]|nr:sugar efflux transporter B [Listeria monocytogenes]GAT39899.1 sugar efflux transporter B [Listeria monocytogenes]GAT42004.1 sugar efflux transporter B [Listeria monocytogenes]
MIFLNFEASSLTKWACRRYTIFPTTKKSNKNPIKRNGTNAFKIIIKEFAPIPFSRKIL